MMKDIIRYTVIALLATVQGESLSQSYVCTTRYLSESERISQVDGYDGLGRLYFTATNGVGATPDYLFSERTYAYGNTVEQEYLPDRTFSGLPSGAETMFGDGQINLGAVTLYDGCDNPYTRYEYDSFGRVTRETRPGMTRHDRTTSYRLNRRDEVLCILPGRDNLTHFPAGSLMVTTTSDEDHKTLETFSDGTGKLILERRAGDNDTYYIHDAYGRLAHVLPPMLCQRVYEDGYLSPDTLALYGYTYRYDRRGDITARQLPGCQAEEYITDMGHRVVFSRHLGEEAGEAEPWDFYLYDRTGRPAVHGQTTDEETVNRYDRLPMTATYTGDGMYGGWDCAIPLSSFTILECNYYDGYGYLAAGLQGTELGFSPEAGFSPASASALGRLAGQMLRTGEGDFLYTAFYYDTHGNVIQSRRQYPCNGLVVESSTYDSFTNQPTRQKTTYRMNGTENMEQDVAIAYNGKGRLSARRYSIASGQTRDTLIHTYRYDSLGYMIHQGRTSESAGMAYRYDWLNGRLKEISSGCGFAQRLYHEDGPGNGLYNGTISSMEWKIPGERYTRRYNYEYDGLNRLVSARYSQDVDRVVPVERIASRESATLGLVPTPGPTGPSDRPIGPLVPIELVSDQYGESITYDRNSNITGMVRRGKTDTNRYGVIDSLTITYNGNQRYNVRDAAGSLSYTGSSEFVDGSTGGSREYAYNGHGALTMDLNRQISEITYDESDNLKRIRFSGNRMVEYVYSSDGTKLKEVHTSGRAVLNGSSDPALRIPGLNMGESDTTLYLSNLIVRDGSPEMLLFDGGYVSFDSDTISGIHYYIQDYMGNNRMVVNRDGTVEQVTHYYPYGGVIGDISTNESLQKYKFEGKELDRTFGLDTYDVHARQYFAMAPMWDRVDPLAEKYYGISLYVYCGGDPVNRGDYDGRADYITSDGKLINRDDNDDGRLFVLRTSQKNFDSYGDAPINGISRKEEKTIIKSGDISNLDFFVEITGSQEIREKAVSLIGDNGGGGESPSNNREYLVYYLNEEDSPENVYLKMGDVGDPSKDTDISVSHGANPTITYIHSHPSGDKYKERQDFHWQQAPSNVDVQNGSTNVSYVAAMGEGYMYMYNNTGILGKVKLSVFRNYKVK